jgi:hypothetical protein
VVVTLRHGTLVRLGAGRPLLRPAVAPLFLARRKARLRRDQLGFRA